MSDANSPIRELVGAHGRKFAVSLALGAVVALGVRSMFVEVDGSPRMANATPAVEHHAEPGHDGHGHDGASPTLDEGNEGDAQEGHSGHGEPAKQKPSEADGEPSAGGEEPNADSVTEKKAEPVGLLLDLGNENCPVMGGAVNAKTFTEWNGLRVGHCCPGCDERFLKNPESLLDEVSPKWREAVKAVETVNAATGEAREKALAALRKKWSVVREPAPAKAQ